VIKGQEIAIKLGDARAANVVMVGAFSNFFKFKEETWLNALVGLLPKKIHELNIAAFKEGRKVL
jgi:indolepyruvate ferredoxin oxidoreductase beta subunit